MFVIIISMFTFLCVTVSLIILSSFLCVKYLLCKRSSLCSLRHKNTSFVLASFPSRVTSSVSFRTNVEMSFAVASIKSELWGAGIFWRDERTGRSDFSFRCLHEWRFRLSFFPFDLISGLPSPFFSSITRDWTRSKITPPRGTEGDLDNPLNFKRRRRDWVFFLVGDFTSWLEGGKWGSPVSVQRGKTCS